MCGVPRPSLRRPRRALTEPAARSLSDFVVYGTFMGGLSYERHGFKPGDRRWAWVRSQGDGQAVGKRQSVQSRRLESGLPAYDLFTGNAQRQKRCRILP